MQNNILLKIREAIFLSHESASLLTEKNSSLIGICLEFPGFRPKNIVFSKKIGHQELQSDKIFRVQLCNPNLYAWKLKRLDSV